MLILIVDVYRAQKFHLLDVQLYQSINEHFLFIGIKDKR